MVRALTFTTLFPNLTHPNHGVFVENRLRRTVALGGVEAVVLAPVPYFPSRASMFGRFAKLAAVPREEARHGLRILHPRYLVIPKIGMTVAPRLLYWSARAALSKLQREGLKFDVIDAHYFYPDGVAAALLGQEFGLPVVITGRGTDLTLIPKFDRARRQIQWAAHQAAAIVTVCQSLQTPLRQMGIPDERLLVLRNGVDLEIFKPAPREAARARWGLTGFTLLCVGGLIPRKGHHIVIEALTELKDSRLLIAGGGPMREALVALAARLGVADRVVMLGEVAHDRLAEIYSAADLMVLASEREGWANVLLEAMACGTRVVATDVDGTSEVVRNEAAGLLVKDRSPAGIAAAIRAARESPIDRQATRRYAEQFGWDIVARANRSLLSGVARTGMPGAPPSQLVADIRASLVAA